jgi:ubiquinone/menaquinone biosynthesis C-methylase UbiE
METSERGRLSNWRDTKGVSAAEAQEMSGRLELRAKAADEVAARDEYLELLGLAPGERALDVGCGSGVVTRELAKRVAPSGRVVGCDSSEALLDVARKYARDAGLETLIEFRAADCRELPFSDGSFDAVIAATVLAHVPGVERAVREMVRVTRVGGRVGVFDFDGDCFLMAHPDRELTRRIVAAQSDQAAVNSQLVRFLTGMLADLAVRDIRVRGFMPLEREAGSFYANLSQRTAEVALKVRAISEAEHARWREQLNTALAAGRFMAGRLHLFVWGTRER